MAEQKQVAVSQPAAPLPNAAAQGDAIAALQKIIAALSASDPQTFYSSADTFEQVATKLTELATALTERSAKLFGTGEGDGWQGEGADACSRIVKQFIDYLNEIIPFVRAWPEHIRGAGEALQQAWYDADAILAKHAGEGAAPAAQPATKSA